MGEIGLVAMGAAGGAAARYAIGRWAGGAPLATLAINVVGSLLLGMLLAVVARRGEPAWPRLLLGTGLLGGFTTFSTFSHEALAMLAGGRVAAGLAYLAASVGGGLAACALGAALGGWLAR